MQVCPHTSISFSIIYIKKRLLCPFLNKIYSYSELPTVKKNVSKLGYLYHNHRRVKLELNNRCCSAMSLFYIRKRAISLGIHSWSSLGGTATLSTFAHEEPSQQSYDAETPIFFRLTLLATFEVLFYLTLLLFRSFSMHFKDWILIKNALINPRSKLLLIFFLGFVFRISRKCSWVRPIA